MSEMVERVARAMVGKSDVILSVDRYEAFARAAIEAMREPTEEMLKSGDSGRAAAFGCYSTWQAMIDEALATRPASGAGTTSGD